MEKLSQQDFLARVLNQDIHAVSVVVELGNISQVLDDLIDKDKPLSDSQIVGAFWNALVALPSNPFYIKHLDRITPLIALCIQDWIDATHLERDGTELGKHLAFVLRDSLISFTVQVAGMVGGYDYMQTVAQDIRSFFYDENFDSYLKGFQAIDASPNKEEL